MFLNFNKFKKQNKNDKIIIENNTEKVVIKKEYDWLNPQTYIPNMKTEYMNKIDKDTAISLILKGVSLGDIAGSIYEGRFSDERNNYKKIIETMYHNDEYYTDDTVMTLATFNALNTSSYEYSYREMFNKYPNVGYGTAFKRWCIDKKATAYNSYGNGSAMRVGPIAILDNIDDVVNEAIKSASVTHNHPEGIKGAVIIAVCTHLLINGFDKDDILNYACKYYSDEDILSPILTLDEYEKTRKRISTLYSVTCMHTVPLAIRCFYESNNYEDCITKAIMTSMDADTCAAIAGCLASVYYKKFNINTVNAWNNYKKDIIDMIKKDTNYNINML